MQSKPKRILFVCLGNICRSPAAEEIFRVMAKKAGLADEAGGCDSCGTENLAGRRSDPRMCDAAKVRGYTLNHAARPVCDADFAVFDLILPMAEDVEEELRRLCPKAAQSRIRPFVDFCVKSRPAEIPDPYYGEEDDFETALDLLEEGCAELVRQLC